MDETDAHNPREFSCYSSNSQLIDGKCSWSVMVYFVVALEVTGKSISASFKKDKFVLFFIYK